jgi:nucleotide-binding universal stress UspA family protein
VVIIGRVGERAAEKNKPIGSNVENFIRGANCTVITVGEHFEPPKRFIFAYEYSPTCQKMLQRIAQSDLLKKLQCHLLYVGDHPEMLAEPEKYLKDAGLDVIPIYRYGDVAQNILEYQREHDIQLIVLGAFSHSKIHQFFLGSITTTIFRNANVPLLVAK